MGTNNLVNVGSAVQEDNVMSNSAASCGLEMIYRPALSETHFSLDVAP
ncbi:MAG TPA: hypothetical protein VFB43_16110 [Terracidiphilus sp.]|nr:hypothetical protein [Terracidiphilus sp.]